MSNSDDIRAEVERTRAHLSSDVNALVEEANPKNIAKRQVNKAKSATVGLKDRIMGSASDAAGSISDTAEAAGDTLSTAPDKVRAQTEGNPIAAGLVAFGAGLLLASLFPASHKERQAAAVVKDNMQPFTEGLAAVAKDTADHLEEPVRQAAQAVGETAQVAAHNVKDEGAAAAGDVQYQAQDAANTVQETRTS